MLKVYYVMILKATYLRLEENLSKENCLKPNCFIKTSKEKVFERKIMRKKIVGMQLIFLLVDYVSNTFVKRIVSTIKYLRKGGLFD